MQNPGTFHIGKEDFDGYYDKYSPSVYLFLIKNGVSKEDAQDLVQDTFVKLWRDQHKIGSPAHLKNWLYLVAWRAAVDLLQARNIDAKETASFCQLQDTDYFDVECLGSEWLHIIYRELEKLPAGERQVIKGLFVDGLTMKEIARQRGVSLKTIYQQKSDGIKKIKHQLLTDQPAKLIILLAVLDVLEKAY